MTKKIRCQAVAAGQENIKVRVIKAPLVETKILRQLVYQRARAIIL